MISIDIRQAFPPTNQEATDMGECKKLAMQIAAVEVHAREVQDICHERASASGWWTDARSGERFPDEVISEMVPTKLMLVVSELSEAMEAHRKDLMDSHLPHRHGLEVELADAAIRIFDMAGALGFDLGAAIAEKLAYNAQRKDHKLAARHAEGGKRY